MWKNHSFKDFTKYLVSKIWRLTTRPKYTKYKINVQAKNSLELGPFSDTITVETNVIEIIDYSLTAPINIIITNITHNSANFSCDNIDYAQNYIIYLTNETSSNTLGSENTTFTIEINTNNYIIPNLNKNSIY